MKSIPWALQSAEIVRQRQKRNGPLNYPQLAVNVQTHPGLADHVIKGEPIRTVEEKLLEVIQDSDSSNQESSPVPEAKPQPIANVS